MVVFAEPLPSAVSVPGTEVDVSPSGAHGAPMSSMAAIKPLCSAAGSPGSAR